MKLALLIAAMNGAVAAAYMWIDKPWFGIPWMVIAGGWAYMAGMRADQ